MRRFLIWTGAILIALPLAAVIVVQSLDLDAYRAEASARVEALTGRALSLGPLHVRWGRVPSLVAEGLRLANAPGAPSPDLLRAARVEAGIDLAALVRGEVRVDRLRLIGLEVNAERTADGAWGWPRIDAGGPAAGERLGVDRLEVVGARLRVAPGGGSAPRLALIEHLTLTRGAGSPPFKLVGRGRLADVPLEVVGAFAAPATKPYRLELRVRMPRAEVRASGSIAEPGALAGLDLDVLLDAVDLHDLARVLRIEAGPWPGIEANARITGDPGNLAIDALHAEIGDTRLEGSLRVTAGDGGRPRVTGALRAGVLDLRPVLGAAGDGADAGGRLFPDRALPLAGLAAADAELDLSAERLRLPETELRDVATRLHLAGGSLALDPLAAGLAGGQLTGRARLRAAAGDAPPPLALELAARAVDLGPLLAVAEPTPRLEGHADIDLSLRARGHTPAALAATLDGDVRVLVRGGRVRLDGLDALVAGLAGLFTEGGQGAGGWTELECAAAGIAFDEGIGEARLVAATPLATVRGGGTVDLRRERLDLLLTPAPRSVTLNVSAPLRVTGPLASPSLRPDEVGTARRVGALLGSLVFPPAAIAAFADLGGDEAASCLRAARTPARAGAVPAAARTRAAPAAARTDERHERAAERDVGHRPRAGGTASQAVENATRGVGEVLNGIGRGIQGLFGN